MLPGEGTLSINKLDLNVILNMPAGPEMDALVAKEVMGYSVDFEEWASGNGDSKRVWFITSDDNQPNRSKIPKFSTDINDAWKIGKKMRDSGNALSLQHRNMVENAPGTAIWTAWFGRANDLAWATTPQLAICRAALLAIRSIGQPQTKTINGNFFPIIEHELAKIMGPIAPVIVNDKIAEFGESRDRFPVNRLDSFVKALTGEIVDDDGRAAFASAMAEFLVPKRWGAKQPHPAVPDDAFSTIEHELAKIMGPIAPIIVNDKIAEFGQSRDRFPGDRLDSFLKALGDEISDAGARAAFAAAMADKLLSARRKS